MVKLDIGSGKDALKGYMGVDIDPRADVVADMGDLPFLDNEVEAIYSSHALEHVSKFRVGPILREWARVIKPGLRCGM
jgi:predicted SAM-dependent methyltransferase